MPWKPNLGWIFVSVLALVIAGVAPAAGQSAAAPTHEEPAEDVVETEADATDESVATETPAEPEGGAESEATQEPDLDELQRQIDVLAEEVERLRSGEQEEETELTPQQIRALGLAPSAARTYQQSRGVSIAGYGEMLFENFAGDKTNQLDFLRAIIYAGYRFNDKFLFNSEIEIEHADEIFLEFAYIDYLVHENLGIRGGLLLVPMGLVNEFHEPPTFLGAERPVTEQVIIPSTWRENGGGVHGSAGMFSYRAFVVNGLRGINFTSGGLRGGRQKGSRTRADDFAFTGRVDVTPTPGVFVGASIYTGGSGQREVLLDDENFRVNTTIFDVHGQAQIRGFDIRGLFATASLADALELNLVLGNEGMAGVADQLHGGYLSFGYDVLSQSDVWGGTQLTPYVRWERVNTQAGLPGGFEPGPSTDTSYNTFGVEVKPIPNVVVKVDHMWVSNDADSGINQWNVNLGYVF